MILGFQSAAELATRIRNREISSQELTDYFIRRIERFDRKVNAVVVRDFDRAREAAKKADKSLANDNVLQPLLGIPVTIKEAYDIAGLPTTRGMPEQKNNIAVRDSDTGMKLKAAGALVLGKTNVPLRLRDGQSYNEIYGTTNNPWDLARIPGGSSGGSAAALAAGLTALESGSDIGGSIRNPAHYCGVYGHKPTWGIVPTQGHSLPGSLATPDLVVVGPMARNAEDLALALDIVAGPNEFDRPGWKIDLPRPTKKRLAEYRVAIWQNHEHAPVSEETSDRVQAVSDRLATLGVKVSDSALPKIDIEEAYRAYLYLMTTGNGATDEEFLDQQEKAARLKKDDFSDDAYRLRGAVQYHRDWLRFNNYREQIRIAWNTFFKDWDILIAPTTLRTAFKHDHSPKESRLITVNNEKRPYFTQIFWAGIFTLAYLPSTVFPTGLSSEGLPLGLQAVGAEFNDHICIDFARLMAEEFGGFVPPPGYED